METAPPRPPYSLALKIAAAVLAALLVGYAVMNTGDAPIRRQTQPIAEDIVKRATEAWDWKEVERRAHPDLLSGVTPGYTLADVFHAFSQLGPRRKFEGCEFLWQRVSIAKNSGNPHRVVKYQCAIVAEKAAAGIDLMLRREENENGGREWRVIAFSVDSPFFKQ